MELAHWRSINPAEAPELHPKNTTTKTTKKPTNFLITQSPFPRRNVHFDVWKVSATDRQKSDGENARKVNVFSKCPVSGGIWGWLGI
jgi:hypothetical protein